MGKTHMRRTWNIYRGLGLKSTGDHGFPGKLEDVLGGKEWYLAETKRLMNFYGHTYQLISPPDGGDRLPKGERRFLGGQKADALRDNSGENGLRGN